MELELAWANLAMVKQPRVKSKEVQLALEDMDLNPALREPGQQKVSALVPKALASKVLLMGERGLVELLNLVNLARELPR